MAPATKLSALLPGVFPARISDCMRASSACSISQQSSAYVSTRTHTSAYVFPARISDCMRASSAFSIIQQSSAYVSIRMHMSAYVSIRFCRTHLRLHSRELSLQHQSAIVSNRQHTSAAYVSIRQHTSGILMLLILLYVFSYTTMLYMRVDAVYIACGYCRLSSRARRPRCLEARPSHSRAAKGLIHH